jgi:spermidine/putrescine transport system ATP-binding protein
MAAEHGRVELRGLVKRFDDQVAVDGLDLYIGAGEFFSLLGSSGCGKTTTLRMIAGFERPDAGAILLDGEDLVQVAPHRRPVNTVFQSYALFPFLTAHDNVAFGLRYQRAGKAITKRRVEKALDLVQMGALAGRKPHQLSGGQQQRVALARALVLEPTVLLLDEPMGALDAKLRKTLQIELRTLQKAVGTTFVYVTHDQDEALTMSDRLAVLHEGRVMQVGTPSQMYSRPANAYVAGFLGAANMYDAVVTSVGERGAWCRIGDLDVLVGECEVATAASAGGSEASVVVRPERVQLHATDDVVDVGGDNTFPATVERLTFRGAQTQVTLLLGGLTMTADVPNVHGEMPGWLREGREVVVRISPGAARLLPRGDEVRPAATRSQVPSPRSASRSGTPAAG